MNKKALTIIEMISALAIVGIIAVITTPFIINLVQKARQDTFVDSAYALVDAANDYRARAILNHKPRTLHIEYPDNKKQLNVSGELPSSGTLNLNDKGEVELQLWSDKAKICVSKTINQDKIEKVEKTKEDCHL